MSEYCGSNEHQHEGSCSCGCGCGKHEHDHHDHSDHCHCAENFLAIADEAYKELLKEKIKEKMIAKKSEHIEKLAELITVANGQKWKHMIAAKTKSHEFKDSLKNFFSSCDE